jgi:hypothetical protein
MGLGEPFCLFARVRIGSHNNALRYSLGGVAATATIDPGVYWLGYGRSNPDGELADEDSLGPSLLKAFDAKLNNLLLALQTGHCAAQTGMAQAKTGHVYVRQTSGTVGELLFADPLTTMDPAWFGVYPPKTVATVQGSSYAKVSDLSSSLVFVSDRGIMAEKAKEGGLAQETIAGTGRTYRVSLAPTLHFRDLTVQMTGLAKVDRDSSYNRFRRFVAALREGGAKKRLVYVPDEREFGTAWAPDGETDAERFGYQELAAEGDLTWDVDPDAPPYQALWSKPIRCRQWVGPVGG